MDKDMEYFEIKVPVSTELAKRLREVTLRINKSQGTNMTAAEQLEMLAMWGSEADLGNKLSVLERKLGIGQYKEVAADAPEVRKLRMLSGMTQQQFGDYFGISRRNIQNWEKGSSSCPPYLLDLMVYKLEKENIIGWNENK